MREIVTHPARTVDLESLLGDDRWIRCLSRGLVVDRSGADDVLQETRLALIKAPPGLGFVQHRV